METKEQVLEKVLGYERPRCPDCGALMSVWEAPIQGLEDGGGWGTPYLFVCFSDTCPSFVNGRVYYRQDRPGARAFCRRMYYPGGDTCESICFLSVDGGKGQIVDETRQRALKTNRSLFFNCLIKSAIDQIQQAAQHECSPYDTETKKRLFEILKALRGLL
jgi:hypothetical protein